MTASCRTISACCVAVGFAGCPSSNDRAPPQIVHRDATVPSFRRDIAPVLAKHCTAKDCHGDEPTTNVAMDLRLPAAYLQLVNVPAEMGDAHLMRVKPGEPDDSMIVHKLAARIGRKEGKPMPIEGDTGEPIVPSPLPFGFVDDVVVPWIRAGALDN